MATIPHDPPMISHYFTLRALCDVLNAECRGALLRESYTQVKGEMAMTLDIPAVGTRTLVICVGSAPEAIFLRDGRSRAKRNSTDIFPGIFGSTVSGIAVDEYSRVVTITAGQVRVKVHLFAGAVSNVFLVDPTDTIIAALSNGRVLAGTRYGAGKAGREVVSPGDTDRLAAVIGGMGGESMGGPAEEAEGVHRGALKTAFPWLGDLYIRELLFRTGRAGPDFVRTVQERLKEMLRETGHPSPRHYRIDGFDGPLLSVIPLTHAESRGTVTYPDVNHAVRETFFLRRNRSEFLEERERLLATAVKDREKTARSLRQAKVRASDEAAPGIHRRTGSLILAHLNEIRKGQTEVELEGEDGSSPQRIRLDRSLTPAGNANLYFDRARKAEKAAEESARRVGELTARLEAIKEWIAGLEACSDTAGLRALVAAGKRRDPSTRVAVDTAGGERLPFRVFPIGEQFEAWVGKSSADNDLLTMKYAGPHDYWFHVRGASGSHVVLKRRSGARVAPPREVIREAARIAAYYSKMRKAGNVPVAYCERKYVKKPKKAPPGTVTLQREEIVFVTPGIP